MARTLFRLATSVFVSGLPWSLWNDVPVEVECVREGWIEVTISDADDSSLVAVLHNRGTETVGLTTWGDTPVFVLLARTGAGWGVVGPNHYCCTGMGPSKLVPGGSVTFSVSRSFGPGGGPFRLGVRMNDPVSECFFYAATFDVVELHSP